MRSFILIKQLALLLTLTAMVQARASGAEIKFQSKTERIALLELYTSEGCSSCPPAEAWLSGLRDSPRLWKDFAPIAFHVDYWNSLGWKDALSDEAYSERQRSYAQLWRAENIYTPEFVLDAKEWRNWLAGKSGPSATHEPAGILTVTSTDTNRWQASFVSEKDGEAQYEIHAALTAGGIGSEVKAGENRGRHLNHDFAVVNLVQIGMTTSNGVARGKFITNTASFNTGKTLALTVWVTRAGEMTPLQTTGGWVVAPEKK
ncbi:MAG TPA: DUF1223 domain-containing protein [Candidatus Acidoferrales bacterium]|jgi:hypothetical protein|nr:DUF1223 domain-containing protein [Candidatus Acidoferrales bacterium]